MPVQTNLTYEILVVEDQADTVMLLRFLLEREGYAVQCATDGRQAQALVSTIAPPTLVILDIMLPYYSGLQLISFIRQQPLWRSIPILMLTSDAAEHDVVQALGAGADDYVTKPFNPRELMARVNRLAGKPSSPASQLRSR